MKPKRRNTFRTKSLSLTGVGLALVGLSVIVYGALVRDQAVTELKPLRSFDQATDFGDARQRAAELIAYDQSITLSAEQQTVMNEALSSIPAPCCAQYSIATCCCPCNLARAVWGLSKFLITREGVDAPQVQAAVNKWIEFTNPGGYTGDACFTRGCERAFDHNGCGGMNENRIS